IRRSVARLVALFAFLAPGAIAPRAAAQKVDAEAAGDGARAIEKGNQGIELYEQGKWNEALERFRRAESIYHSPVFVLYAARTLRNAGRLLEARAEFRRLLAEPLGPTAPELWKQAQRDGGAELAALEATIPSVVVDVEGGSPTTRLAVDDRPAAPGEHIDLEPGRHRLVATDGTRTNTQEFSVVAGERERVVLVKLPPATASAVRTAAPAEPRTRWSVPGLVLVGTGGAALVAGGIVGVVALKKKNDVRENLPEDCQGTTCPVSKKDEVEAQADTARSLGTVANVLIVGGGVAAAAGVGFLIWGSEKEPAVTARVSTRSADLTIAF
ncbi:MAG TPA: hypothetical protein VF103_05565, partial [Polyangiaceae bacterium]